MRVSTSKAHMHHRLDTNAYAHKAALRRQQLNRIWQKFAIKGRSKEHNIKTLREGKGSKVEYKEAIIDFLTFTGLCKRYTS